MKQIVAERDSGLSAAIVDERDLLYEDGECTVNDRPQHVRAASGIALFGEYLAIVQDDSNWLALVDPQNKCLALPLPPAPESGRRVFSTGHGNKHEKFDLEACISVLGEEGPQLVGFGSGSHPGREWILRVSRHPVLGAHLVEGARGEEFGFELEAAFHDATPFYDALRANREFSGAGLNIEGAVMMDGDTLRFFERGNAPVTEGFPAMDATGDVSWEALRQHLEAPDEVTVPEMTNIRQYELGSLGDTKLTFSDAEKLEGDRVLFSASAEGSETGYIAGSVIGVIEADGSARWTEVTCPDGSPFDGKVEGLALRTKGDNLVHFVVDDDDETLPSRFFTARLEGFGADI